MFDINKVAMFMSYDYNSLVNSNIHELSRRFNSYRMKCPHGMWIKTCKKSGIPYSKCNKLVQIYRQLYENGDYRVVRDIANSREFWEGLF